MARKPDPQFLMARGLMWGRLLNSLEIATEALKVVKSYSQELLSPEGAKLAESLHDTNMELEITAWGEYNKIHAKLEKKR